MKRTPAAARIGRVRAGAATAVIAVIVAVASGAAGERESRAAVADRNASASAIADGKVAAVSDRKVAAVSDRKAYAVADANVPSVSDRKAAVVSDRKAAVVSDPKIVMVSDVKASAVSGANAFAFADAKAATVSDTRASAVSDAKTTPVSGTKAPAVSDTQAAPAPDAQPAAVADTQVPAVSDAKTAPSAALLARGAYLAKAADCAGCHTAPDHGAPWAGGLGMGSPFGTIVTSNITPDRRYGIGAYSLHDFERAIRHGVARGGKRLYPAMPYVSFSKLSDGDVAALYAYVMHDVAPVAKPTPPSDVAFPFNQRWALRFWQWVFVPGKPYAPKPAHDAQWNRGAYLVQGAGHCGACHTPRGAAYQEKGYDETSSSFLVGGINDHWFAPNLTGDPGSGLGRMSAEDIAAFLKTGHGGIPIAYGSMVEQIEDSTQYLTDADLLAIAHYLKSLPAQQPYGGYTPGADTPRSAQNGNRVADAQSLGYNVYLGFCARCHRDDGSGAPPVFPALAGNPSVLTEDTTSLIRLLVEGGNSPSTLTGPPRTQMPAFAGVLTDVQMAQALTYIRSAWGNDAQPITANDVSTLRGKLHK